MKPITNIVGIILIILGIVSLGYHGFTYTKREKVAEIGSLSVTADKDKTVTIPPAAGGIALLAGIVLVVVARSGNRR